MKFKVGDRVVNHGAMALMLGRPRVRIVEKVYEPNSNGTICYGGKYWKAAEEMLVLADEYKWPTEAEMQAMDNRAKNEYETALNDFVKDHCEGEHD